ncbi:MAG: exonuclease SbcCD subunit D [Oscillospiraceae bacterium]|nr:exonuclease SbcCD subunit D [Oscillospiraceae bacterium]
MKLMHLSDLHLGKRVNDFSMIEDQKYILDQILNMVDVERPIGVLIAGDVYDRAVPSAEAVELLDSFLYRLCTRNTKVFLISGNHDSAERLAFASRLLTDSGVYLSPVYDGKIEAVTLCDEFGDVNIYMLPFVKPAQVRRYFEEETIESYTDAVRVAVGHMQLDKEKRNILVTHQFVTGAVRCESEEISVGGTDNVDASVFEAFDYVALGHIHGPQNIAHGKIRYCGTPLKYSFSECAHEKSVTIVELFEKGNLQLRTLPLVPRHDMRQLRGTYEELTAKENYAGTAIDDYLHITLTDEEDVPEAVGRLRVIYPNLMRLSYDNARTRSSCEIDSAREIEQKSPLQLFEELYEQQNRRPMEDVQRQYVQQLIEAIWKEDI